MHTKHGCKRCINDKRIFHLNVSCHTCERVMSQPWMRHATHMSESCHRYEWVMSHMRMSHVTHLNEHDMQCHDGSCHTCEWAMSHIWMNTTCMSHIWINTTWAMSHISMNTTCLSRTRHARANAAELSWILSATRTRSRKINKTMNWYHQNVYK